MKKNELKQYLKLLDKGLLSLDNDFLFQEILKKSEILMMSDLNLSIEMQMNKATITRWKSGTTTPEPLMRRGIYTWLKKRTNLFLEKF